MRITQEASYLMVIQHKGTLGYLLGILFATLGVLFLLNIFLGNTFSYNQVIVPAILILAGLITITFTAQITLTLDKEKNRISYIEERIVSGKSEERDLKQIDQVQLREKIRMRKGKISRDYTLALTFKDRPEILVRFPSISLGMLFWRRSNLASIEEISQKIANFLGVKLMKPQTLTEAIGTAIPNVMPQQAPSSIPAVPK